MGKRFNCSMAAVLVEVIRDQTQKHCFKGTLSSETKGA